MTTASAEYRKFLERKSQWATDAGFDPLWVPDFLFDFQRHLVTWAIRRGRAAIFADCGLGKTAMQLVWAENIVRKTNRPVLILTPLAVGAQTVREAAKFGIEAARSIERAVVMWSNPGETVLTPFMGVGSEVFGAVINGRRGIGIELKPSYYRQAVKNLESSEDYKVEDNVDLFAGVDAGCDDDMD